jgi:hypothetical protein
MAASVHRLDQTINEAGYVRSAAESGSDFEIEQGQ